MGADPVTTALGRRAPKTRKGKRIVEKRQGQVHEDPKTALVLRGNKCSIDVQTFLRDLYRLRAPLATLFMRKHEEHPFEDIARVEKLCVKYDHSLFAFGSSSKKRPFRLILGRLFDNHLLDMQEFAVTEYKPVTSFKSSLQEPVLGCKPLVIFQGPAFESDDQMKRAKSLLLDFFGGPTPEKVMLEGLEQAIVCTALDTGATAASSSTAGSARPSGPAYTVLVQRFRTQFLKSGSRLPRVELQEIGPRFKLAVDRTRDPQRDRWKQSIRVPKEVKKKKDKNISHDSLGKKKGRIHLGKQDFDQIHTVHHGKAKRKKLLADLEQQSKKKKRGAPAESGKSAGDDV